MDVPTLKLPQGVPDGDEGVDFCRISFTQSHRVGSLPDFSLLFRGPRTLFAEPLVIEAPKTSISLFSRSSQATCFESQPAEVLKTPVRICCDRKEQSEHETRTLESMEEASWPENPVQRLVLRAFTNEEIPPQELELCPKDQVIFLAILKRKFGLKLEEEGANLQEVVRAISGFQSKKRKEENRKYVFKRVTKSLRTKFTESAHYARRVSKQTIDADFYQHYFGQLAQQLGKQLQEFYLPGSCTGLTASNKTFTDGYISLIKQSDTFRNDFELALRNLIQGGIREMVRSKVAKMFRKLDALQAQAGEEARTKYVLADKKGKLPWTATEIRKALTCVLDSFDLSHSMLEKS